MFKPLSAAAVSLLVISCGSGSDGGESSGAVTSQAAEFGLVLASATPARDDLDIPETNVAAIFGRYQEVVDFSTVTAMFRMPIDTCVISVENEGSNRVDNIEDGPAFARISAGPALTFDSANGLQYQATGFNDSPRGVIYVVDPEPLFPLPQGLVVDIPGQAFPAFTQALPDVAPLVGFMPQSDSSTTLVTPDTTFTWQPGNDPNARILIRTDITETGTSAANGNPTPIDFYCDVADDGLFEFPEEFKTALGADYSNLGELDAQRRSISVAQRGISALLVVRDRFAD